MTREVESIVNLIVAQPVNTVFAEALREFQNLHAGRQPSADDTRELDLAMMDETNHLAKGGRYE